MKIVLSLHSKLKTMVEKIKKTFVTLAVVTLFLPILFLRVHTVIYSFGKVEHTEPRFQLFLVPLAFITLWLLTELWDKELKKILEK